MVVVAASSLSSSKIRGEEQRESVTVSVTVSVTCEWRCREPLVARASEDERKERMYWFHATFWMPGTMMTE